MNLKKMSTAYFSEQSIRNLIKLLAENYASRTPKTKLPQTVFKSIQKIIDNEGKLEFQTFHLKRIRPDAVKLVTLAKSYKKKSKSDSIGRTAKDWLYNSNLRKPSDVQQTKRLFNYIDKDLKIGLEKIESEFIRCLNNKYLDKKIMQQSEDFEKFSEPSYLCGHILYGLGYPSYQTQNKRLAKSDLNGTVAWKLVFEYLFKNVFPLPPAVYDEVWGAAQPHITDIGFNILERIRETEK